MSSATANGNGVGAKGYPSDPRERAKMLVAEGRLGGAREGSGPRSDVHRLRAVAELVLRSRCKMLSVDADGDGEHVRAIRQALALGAADKPRANRGELDAIRLLIRSLFESVRYAYPQSVKFKTLDGGALDVELIYKRVAVTPGAKNHVTTEKLIDAALKRNLSLREGLDLLYLFACAHHLTATDDDELQKLADKIIDPYLDAVAEALELVLAEGDSE